MKKVLTLFLMIALTMTVMAQKPRVAVYVSGDDPINELVGSSLEDGLAHNGKYTAVERTASFLSALSKEHEFQRSGEVDDDQIAELGKQFSVQYVCVASVSTVWGNEKYISARIIDVESAEVVASGNSNGATTTTDQLIRALDGLSESLLNALDYSKKAGAKKVAVYVTKSGNRDVDIILGDQLVAGFAKSGKYLAIERTSRFLSELSKEQGYQQSGAVSDEDLVRLGQKAGVQYVCVAKTSKFNDDYFISSRLIDVVHGDIVNSSYEKGKKLNNSNNVISVAADIATKLSGRTIEEEADYKIKKQKEENEKILKVQGWVDLGLSVYWKNQNDAGLCTYDQAVSQFGRKLPTKEQFEELKIKCRWTWTGSGYNVTGPNGNTIYLPATGYRTCDGSASHVGTYGCYWSSTPDGSDYAWDLYFGSGRVFMDDNVRCYGGSVRLVQDK